MDILQSMFARCGIAQVTHKKRSPLPASFTGTGRRSSIRDSTILGSYDGDALEYLSNGILAFCPLTEHIFLTSGSIQIDAGYTGTLLSTVVLLFHHQVKLVQSIMSGAVLPLVIFLWFQQANHRHTTLMLQLFHCCKL